MDKSFGDSKVVNMNTEKLNSVKGETFTIKAIHFNALQKHFKPFIDEKDGVVGNTGNIRHQISR